MDPKIAELQSRLSVLEERLRGRDKLIDQKFAELTGDVQDVKDSLLSSSGTMPIVQANTIRELNPERQLATDAVARVGKQKDGWLSIPVVCRGNTEITLAGGLLFLGVLSLAGVLLLFVVGAVMAAYKDDADAASRAVRDMQQVWRKEDPERKDEPERDRRDDP